MLFLLVIWGDVVFVGNLGSHGRERKRNVGESVKCKIRFYNLNHLGIKITKVEDRD